VTLPTRSLANDPDPFSDAADASRETTEIRRRAFARPAETVDLVGKPRRKKTDLNPVQRRWFEANGYVYARVETANAWGGMVCDLWSAFDYIAVHPERPGTLYVQVCTLGDVSKRRRKVRAAPETAVLLAAGNRVQLHAWSQPDGPGTRWVLKVETVSE
jgi:hypothetical protein